MIDYCNAIALQPDGKIVAAGGSSDGITSYISLARYNNGISKRQIIITKIRHWINNNNIKLSPNPATSNLHIEGLPTSNIKLTVVDFAGNIALSVKLSAFSTSYNLNIASLHQGNYLLKIETNGEVITKQFVKE